MKYTAHMHLKKEVSHIILKSDEGETRQLVPTRALGTVLQKELCALCEQKQITVCDLHEITHNVDQEDVAITARALRSAIQGLEYACKRTHLSWRFLVSRLD